MANELATEVMTSAVEGDSSILLKLEVTEAQKLEVVFPDTQTFYLWTNKLFLEAQSLMLNQNSKGKINGST